jgi:hypothetical protein
VSLAKTPVRLLVQNAVDVERTLESLHANPVGDLSRPNLRTIQGAAWSGVTKPSSPRIWGLEGS